jgi:hypothetical protein
MHSKTPKAIAYARLSGRQWLRISRQKPEAVRRKFRHVNSPDQVEQHPVGHPRVAFIPSIRQPDRCSEPLCLVAEDHVARPSIPSAINDQGDSPDIRIHDFFQEIQHTNRHTCPKQVKTMGFGG